MADKITLTCLDCGQKNRLPADRLSAGPKCATCGAPLADGRVAEIDAETLDRAAKADGAPLVVDFWAPWCGPCRMMAPQFAAAARTLTGAARFAKLNTEDHPRAGAAHGIRGIPAVVVFRDGREVGRLAGARPAAEIESFVRGHTRQPA